MKKLLVLILLAFSVLCGQEGQLEISNSPFSRGDAIAFADFEVHQPSDFAFVDDSGLAIVTIDMETGNVTIADSVGMNEASRKFWKMLQEVVGRQEKCDCSSNTRIGITVPVSSELLAIGSVGIGDTSAVDSPFQWGYRNTEWRTNLSCRHFRGWQHLTMNNGNLTPPYFPNNGNPPVDLFWHTRDLTAFVPTTGTVHVGERPFYAGCTSLRIDAGGVVCNDPTTGDTGVTTKGDPSTSTNLFKHKEKK